MCDAPAERTISLPSMGQLLRSSDAGIALAAIGPAVAQKDGVAAAADAAAVAASVAEAAPIARTSTVNPGRNLGRRFIRLSAS